MIRVYSCEQFVLWILADDFFHTGCIVSTVMHALVLHCIDSLGYIKVHFTEVSVKCDVCSRL